MKKALNLIPSFLAVAFTALVSNIVQAEGANSPQPPSQQRSSQQQGSQQPTQVGTERSQQEADNTGRNERDRSTSGSSAGSKLEATDQSNSSQDVDLTSKIRRAITEDNSLSMNAHNVKIITVNGRVTLRGPVDSDAERRKVESIARKIAGQRPVTNELEVKKQ